MSENNDRLERWARLKAESGRPAPEASAPAPDEDEADEAFVAALPKIEEIGAATDIRGFLRKGVPEALRTAALARAWLADPAIRDRVPDAVDYAENYNAPHTIAGWGDACPQEARGYVERTLERCRETAGVESQGPAPASVETTQGPAPAQVPVVESADSAPSDAETRPNRGRITKNRSRHGGAMPQES